MLEAYAEIRPTACFEITVTNIRILLSYKIVVSNNPGTYIFPKK